MLTVLDFIGQHRKEYRFDVRYRALTGATRRALGRQIEQGFPYLPSGSQIILDRVAQRTVLANVRSQIHTLGEGLQHVPLATHAHYRREEILAALGYATLKRPAGNHQSGVAWVEPENVDAFMVSLKKSEKDFLPTTMYRDYAMSPELFHWESQNSTSLASPTGRRYVGGNSRVLLFVRAAPSDDLGTAPYLCLGQASYVAHEGEKPIAITWRLHRPMPAETFSIASVAA